jgi:hypothetical protein
MKRKFECGHTGKGRFCHACAALQAARSNAQQERQTRREAKQLAAASDGIDLSPVNHLKAVQREARALLEKVRNGTHPYALRGRPLKATAGAVLSVPVGLSYRILFDAPTLAPLRIVSHEDYNLLADGRT